MKEYELELCWKLLSNTSYTVVIVEISEITKIYLTRSFRVKTMNTPYNEVIDGQDITDLVTNQEFNFATRMSDDILETKVQNIPLQTFKFGTDNYLWLTSIKENKRY